ncbi:DegV family protein with EDD domain [Bacilli bacterium PM5-3]|nr:DegV family protein with EDD domain [Bacilli bacterium PM5-3]MDH6604336.1 DegV family protein with EDD domain [Bacilli bacterium PM5-9]
MKKVAFVTDSGTGLSVSEVEELGCYSVPLQISYDDKSLLENEDINVDEVYQLVSEGKMLKTSLPPLSKIEELFLKLKNEGYEKIFAVPICSGLSGTINAMVLSAKEVGIDFDYFDNGTTAMIERYMVVRAKALYESGKTFDEIKSILSKICQNANTFVIPNDLHHLKRGGRLTAIAASLGSLLKIKPVLEINIKTEGRIDVLDKVRTMSRALKRTISALEADNVGDGLGYNITIAHVLANDEGLKLLEMYKEKFPKANYNFIKLVSVVGVHTGPGCLAVQYFKEL